MLWFFISLIKCTCDESKSLVMEKTGQHNFLLVDGSTICLITKSPNQAIILNHLGEATVAIDLTLNGVKQTVNDFPSTVGGDADNISAVYFGGYNATLEITTKSMINVKFTYVAFPDDCKRKVITNTRNATFEVTKDDSNHHSICYFNGVYGSYDYKVKYNIDPDNDMLRIIRHDDRPRIYTSDNRFSGQSLKDEPVLIYVYQTDQSKPLNSTVTMTCTTLDDIAEYNTTWDFEGNEPQVFHGLYMDDRYPEPEDDTVSQIVAVALVIIFILCAIGCVIYKIYRCILEKRLRREKLESMKQPPTKRYKKIVRSKHSQKKYEQKRAALLEQHDNKSDGSDPLVKVNP